MLPRKCIWLQEVTEHNFLVFYRFPPPPSLHSLLIYHSISFIVSFKLQVCGDLMLDFPPSVPLPGVYDHHKVCFTHAATWPRTYYFWIIPSVHIFLALQCSMSLFKRSLHAGDVSVWFICTFIYFFSVFWNKNSDSEGEWWISRCNKPFFWALVPWSKESTNRCTIVCKAIQQHSSDRVPVYRIPVGSSASSDVALAFPPGLQSVPLTLKYVRSPGCGGAAALCMRQGNSPLSLPCKIGNDSFVEWGGRRDHLHCMILKS